jgi:hypothetical protein
VNNTFILQQGASSNGGYLRSPVYQPSHDQDQQSEAREHNERALAEILLPSYSDMLKNDIFV